MTEPTDEDSIGYGHPPKEHQFKKGQSGNPHGRPKKVIDHNAVLEEELRRTITIVEDGQEKTISVHQAIVRVFCQRAMKGKFAFAKDLLASARSLSVERKMEDTRESKDPLESFIEEFDEDEEE